MHCYNNISVKSVELKKKHPNFTHVCTKIFYDVKKDFFYILEVDILILYYNIYILNINIQVGSILKIVPMLIKPNSLV